MRVRTEVSFLGVGEVFYDEVEVLDEEEVRLISSYASMI
jgi:hypothetical protein